MNSTAFLAALQLADTALPIGRFVHSHGLEALVASEPDITEEELVELVETVVLEGIAPLDGVAVRMAHDHACSQSLAALVELDRSVTVRKLNQASRQASRSCGRRLAALVPALTDAEPCASFAAFVRGGETDGNLAVVEGALAAALSIPCAEAVLIELRGAAAALLAAVVRLDRLSAARAQAALHRLAPVLGEAAMGVGAMERSEMRSVAPELEIHALRHTRSQVRLFAT